MFTLSFHAFAQCFQCRLFEIGHSAEVERNYFGLSFVNQ